MFYKAKANVDDGTINIRTGQSIKKEVYDSLSERSKIKFVAVNEKTDAKPAGFNEIIGDTPEEKAFREKVETEEAGKVTDENSSELISEDNSEKAEEAGKVETKEAPKRKR